MNQIYTKFIQDLGKQNKQNKKGLKNIKSNLFDQKDLKWFWLEKILKIYGEISNKSLEMKIFHFEALEK